MEIEYKGGNCVVITHKKNTFVVDPKISDLGLKDQGTQATAQLLTQQRFAVAHSENTIVLDGPGEFEVRNCSVMGIAAQAHTDSPETPKSATMYRIELEDTAIAVVGHIFPNLSEAQMEALGMVDILIVPVGGHGYTLDAKGAVELVRAVDPKIVIPTHFAEDGVQYEVPQAGVEEFLKELGGVQETTAKLKIKGGQLPGALTTYYITRTK